MVTFAGAFWCSALFVAAVCCILYYLLYSRQIAKWKESNIPFLSPVFLFGHKHIGYVGRKIPMVAALDRVYRENQDKDVVGFFMGPQPVIMIRDIKLIQQIIVKNADKVFKNQILPLHDDIETQSTIALCSDKTRWRADRTALSPIFHTSKMGEAHDKFQRQVERALEYAEETRCAGQPLQVSKLVHSFILDTIIWWIFGDYTNSLVERTTAHEAFYAYSYLSSFKLIKCFLIFWFPPIQKLGFRVFPQKSFNYMRSLLEQKLKTRSKSEREVNLVEHFVSLKEKGVFASQKGMQDLDTDKQNEMIMREMTGLAWMALIGSTETLIKACMHSIHLLSLHPEYQDKIKMEIDQVMKKHSASKLTHQVIQDLRFTEQCVYETARIITDVPFIGRRCSEDFQIPGTKYVLRKNDIILVCPYSVNSDPKYFENPKTFKPERFDSVQSWSTLTSDVLLNFGLGPRKCPGYPVAIRLVVLFLAAFVSKYEIKPRSHLREMTNPEDLNPASIPTAIKGNLLVDLVPR